MAVSRSQRGQSTMLFACHFKAMRLFRSIKLDKSALEFNQMRAIKLSGWDRLQSKSDIVYAAHLQVWTINRGDVASAKSQRESQSALVLRPDWPPPPRARNMIRRM